jgi:Cdc6-like AAA superfamily ATPase
LVVRKALSEFQITVGSKVFDYVYVNLKKCRTTTTAANKILEALSDRQIPKNLGIDRIFQEIWFAIQKRRSSSQPFYLALILDEIDTIFLDKHYNPSDFLRARVK